MKRILAVTLTLVISMFALSCQKIVDDTTSQVTDDITYSNSPTFDASVWTGSGNGDVLRKEVITRSVTATATNGSVESTVATVIPLTTESVSLTLNADKTFTRVVTESYTANSDTNYVADNYNYSTSGISLNEPAAAYPLTRYMIGDTQEYAVIGGNLVSVGGISSSLYTLSTTASGTYNGAAVYTVTFDTVLQANPASAGTLSGKPKSTTTHTGTWSLLDTTDPVDNTQRIRLTPTSYTSKTYNYSGTAVTSWENTGAYDPDTTWYWEITKGLDAAGVDTYYAEYGDIKVYLNK